MRSFRILVILVILCLPRVSPAATYNLDASFSQVFEDNVNLRLSVSGGRAPTTAFNGYLTTGALSTGEVALQNPAGTGKSDFYSVLSAGAGVSTVAGVETYLSIQAEFTHYRFNRFQALNSTGLGLRATLSKQLSDMNSCLIAFFGRMNEYEDHSLDGGSFGTSLEVRQQLSQKFALAEGFTWEKSGANDWMLGSTINAVLFRGTYRFTQQFAAALTYGYLHWKYNAGSQTGLHSVQLRGTWQMVGHLGVYAAVERQLYETMPNKVSGGDNITSAGLELSY